MRGPARLKVATLDTRGREKTVFQYFTAYNVNQDIRQLVSKARITIKPGTSEIARRFVGELDTGCKVALFVDGTRVLTGFREDIESGQDEKARAPTAVITIADVLSQVVDDALPDGFSLSGLTVFQVFERLLEPYGIEVVEGNVENRLATTRTWRTRTEDNSVDLDPEAARLQAEGQREGGSLVALQEYMEAHPTTTVKRLSETKESRDLHPRPNETTDKFLIRFARANGLLVWASGDGKAIVSAPDWTRTPEIEFYRSTTDRRMRHGRILGGTLVRQPGRLAHEVQVLGHHGKRGESKIVGVARDETAIFDLDNLGRRHRILRITDNSLRDQADAQRRAETTLAQAKMAGKTYTCRVQGHGVGTALQAIDQMAHIIDDCCLDEGGVSLDASLWTVGRSFDQSDRGALRTALTFAWPGSWSGETA